MFAYSMIRHGSYSSGHTEKELRRKRNRGTLTHFCIQSVPFKKSVQHTHVSAYKHTYTHTCVHTYTHTYIYTCTHACTRTYGTVSQNRSCLTRSVRCIILSSSTFFHVLNSATLCNLPASRAHAYPFPGPNPPSTHSLTSSSRTVVVNQQREKIPGIRSP